MQVIHNSNEHLDHVDFQPLFDWINEQVGQKIQFKIDLSTKRPQILTSNLQELSGIFSAVVKEVSVDFFSFFTDENGFVGSVHLYYESWDGGTNGMKIGTVGYSFSKGWEFKSAKEARISQDNRTY